MSYASLLATATTTAATTKINTFFPSPQRKPNSIALPRRKDNDSSAVSLSGTQKSSIQTFALSSNKAGIYPMCETIEHIVLFKMKPNTNLDILIQELNNLKRLPGVIYLTAGYVYDMYSSNTSLDYTIFLHSRHRNKQDLDIYMHCPEKLKFTNTYTELYYEDYALVDWVTYHPQPLHNPSVGTALRATFLDMKEDGWGVICDVVGDSLGDLTVQQTFGGSYIGKTYRPQNKGFSIASLGVYPGIFQLQAVGSPEEFAKKLEGDVKAAIDNIMVVDYIVKDVYVSSHYGTI
ncbi:hypothetical protein ACHQM5_018826 [Ranunculus cassubicifolius]